MKFLFAIIFPVLILRGNCQGKSIFSVPLLPPDKEKEAGGSSQMQMPGMQEPVIPNDSAGSAILHKGWLKYFYYMPTGKDQQPKSFEFNSAFTAQMAGGVMPSRVKDSYGFLDIPTETSFFFILTHKTLYVVSARKNGIAKTVKSLQISWIKPAYIHANNIMSAKGGLENIGDFDEGYCFRLRLRTGIIWDMCGDKNTEKMNWMNQLYPLIPKLGPNSQGESASVGGQGGVVSSVATKFVYNASLWFNVKDADAKLTKRRDGKWVIIQDWSQCSKVCGSGESFQQRMCIPPVSGGRPCFGESILRKLCNEDPCPNTIIDNVNSAGGSIDGKEDVYVTTTQAPIVKIQKLSDKYQRFTPCVVKESLFFPLFSGFGYLYTTKWWTSSSISC